uniref:Flavin-containing monooxygenase n=1 Tax=Strigamia maritima TaxID=126957 RepID=T1IZ89_STRMM
MFSHYSEPRIPAIPDLDKFQGKVVHSHSYREPSDYTGLRVLCLGAGPSGVDICLDISKYASIVKSNFYNHNKAKKFTDYDVPGVLKANPNGVCLTDGTFRKIDALIFCTGYIYSYPFLSPNCDITVTDDYVFPLYKHLINAHKPSMAFLGLPFLVTPLPLLEFQARFFLHTLLGTVHIPSLDKILK